MDIFTDSLRREAAAKGRIHDLEQAFQHILGLALDGEIPAAVACREIADTARHALDGRTV